MDWMKDIEKLRLVLEGKRIVIKAVFFDGRDTVVNPTLQVERIIG